MKCGIETILLNIKININIIILQIYIYQWYSFSVQLSVHLHTNIIHHGISSMNIIILENSNILYILYNILINHKYDSYFVIIMFLD